MSSPKSISGFPEYLPAQQLVFQQWISKIQGSFESYGYAPMETPAVERLSTLVAKGAAEHEIYTLSRYREQSRSSSEEFGLRFDLTVPLARYVSQHAEKLIFPFKRYQIATVWRGERPQRGRSRQFYQCDIDALGQNTLALSHDAEVLETLQDTLDALNIGVFELNLNHKKLLFAILEWFSIDPENYDLFLRILDKRQKISVEMFSDELRKVCGSSSELIAFLDAISGPFLSAMEALRVHPIAQSKAAQAALQELEQIQQQLPAEHIDRIILNLSLARGLAYYTGIVFETFLVDSLELGSIASGGRYDHLTQQFSSRAIPGVGMSIGLSRLFHYKVIESDQVSKKATKARVLMTTQDMSYMPVYKKLARELRLEGVCVDHYLEKKDFSHQIKYADKKGFEYIIMARAEEIEKDEWIVKNLETGCQVVHKKIDLITFMKSI